MKPLLPIFLLFFLSLSSLAQEYVIQGRISDQKTGKGIKKAKLSLYNSKDSLIAVTFSDRKGRYKLKAKVQEKDYILVQKEEYEVKRFVSIPVGRSATGDFSMEKKQGAYRSHFFSPSDLKAHREYKTLKLKAEDLKAVEKDGKKVWTVKTTLINRSRHTRYFFMSPNCPLVDFSVDTTALSLHTQNDCGSYQRVAYTLAPKAQYSVELAITEVQPLSLPLSFRVVMFYARAKSKDDTDPNDNYKGALVLFSNTIKIEEKK